MVSKIKHRQIMRLGSIALVFVASLFFQSCAFMSGRIQNPNFLPIPGKIPGTDTVIEEGAQFHDGYDGLLAEIKRSTVLPWAADKFNIQGIVYVSFKVNEYGEVEDVKTVRDVDFHLDQEAIRVVSKLRPWKPGIRDGQPITLEYVVPVAFQIPDAKK
jgi:TonB family protein